MIIHLNYHNKLNRIKKTKPFNTGAGFSAEKHSWKALSVVEEEELPEQVTGLLSSVLHEGEPPIYYVLSDIDENGNFGERWLILTKETVITANPTTNHT